MPFHTPAFPDPFTALLSTAAAPAASSPPAPPSLSVLHTQIREHRWADVLTTSSTLLCKTPAPDEALLLQTYRALALHRTGQTSRANQLIAALGDLAASNPVYTYEHHHPRYTQSGSFVPFLLRLLILDIRLRARGVSALPAGYELLEHASGVEKVAVLSLLAGHALRAGLSDMAIDLAREVAQMRNDADSQLTLAAVYLHLHDVENAETAVRTAELKRAPLGRVAVYRGMIAAAQGEYEQALECYDAALADAGRVEPVPRWWACALNNSAVCLLQMGRLMEAVQRIENALAEKPVQGIQEGVVFNLATMYQLAFPDEVREKRRVLRKVAERFGRQGFDIDGVGL